MPSTQVRLHAKRAALALLGLAAVACTSKPDTRSNARTDAGDQVAGASSGVGSDTMSPSTPRGDTAMSMMSGTDSVANPDQQFLRMMSDHHKGLLLMAHDAIERRGVTVTAKAQKLDKEQDAELDRMLSMLKADFKDDYKPMVMPENQAMADSLKQKYGEAYDTTFRENIIKHHQEALEMIDRFLPQLTQPELKQMAQKMKAAQTREIEQLKRELGR